MYHMAPLHYVTQRLGAMYQMAPCTLRDELKTTLEAPTCTISDIERLPCEHTTAFACRGECHCTF